MYINVKCIVIKFYRGLSWRKGSSIYKRDRFNSHSTKINNSYLKYFHFFAPTSRQNAAFSPATQCLRAECFNTSAAEKKTKSLNCLRKLCNAIFFFTL